VRKSLLVVLIVPAFLLSACGDKGGDSAATPPAPQAWEVLADRLVSDQHDDGSFSAAAGAYAPFFDGGPTASVTGLEGLGLLDAHLRTPNQVWRAALDKAKDYLVDACVAYASGAGSIALTDILFLKRYETAFGFTTADEANAMGSAFHKIALDYDATHGTDPSVYIDGVLNRIKEVRDAQGLPALTAWDAGFLVKLLVAYGGNLNGADPQWAFQFQKDRFAEVSPTDEGAAIAAAHSVDALVMAGDHAIDGAAIGLLSGLPPITNVQQASYVRMAYTAVGSAVPDAIETLLRNEVDAGSATTAGEALQALLR
jgi:hypothetical protein